MQMEEESFILLENNEIYIHEHLEAYLNSHKDNLEIKILNRKLNFAYSKLKINQKCPQKNILNIEDMIKKIIQLSTKIQSIISGQSDYFIYAGIINENLLYLKSHLPKECYIININDIDCLLDNLSNNISGLGSNSTDNTNQNINEESLVNNIKGINDAFNQIINFINIFYAFKSKILSSIQDKYLEIAKYEDRIQDKKDDESQDKKDDESQDKKDDESQDKEEDESQDKKDDESQDKKEDKSQDKKDEDILDKKDENKYDIRFHFEQEISALSKEISKKISKINQDSLSIANNNKVSQLESKTNHPQVSFDGNSFLFSKRKSFLDEFASLFTNDQLFIFDLALLRSYPEIKSLPLKICSIEQLFDEIQLNGKTYYLDYFCKIILKHLFSQDLIIHHYETIGQSISVFKVLVNMYEIKFDKNLNFFLEDLSFSSENQEKEREKQIMKDCKSKFIVHTKPKMGTISEIDTIPYFPFGSLYSLFDSKPEERINFTFVDKVVMILEIATALEDLHSHGQYHGNLCSDFIFINSSKDAYLSGFSYDRKVEENSKVILSPFFYRPNENNSDNSEFKKLVDIYSFGVLMIVILTEKNPQLLFAQVPIRQIISHHKKIINELYSSDDFPINDDQGNCIIGIKEIINKCMIEEKEKRYQSFKELIVAIHSLSIYEKNKEEIDFRISMAEDAANYECSISNLLESCWYGQSNQIIELFLNKYNENVFWPKKHGKHLENIVSKTISFIDFDINSFLFNLSNLKYPVDSSLFASVIKSYYKYYYKYVLKSSKNELICNTLSTIDKIYFKIDGNSNSSSKDKIDKIYLFDHLAHLILRSILGQERFSKKYQTALYQSRNNNSDDFVTINKELKFGSIGTSHELVIDNNMKLYLRIKIEKNVNKWKIFNENVSPFIVCPQSKNSNQLILPYFPIGSLKSIINETQPSIEFTLVDKFVIILEIATALNDLHYHGLYHGNLCSDFIFINSSKDAYLAGVCYARETEEKSNEIPETDNEQMKLSDVYSFGVLMKEILTNKSPQSSIENRTKQKKNGIQEMKEIIEKCMKTDDLIKEVPKTKFYNQNKVEIEFRLSNAAKPKDYQCNISDLFESYYQGQESSKDDIENIIKKYNEIASKDDKDLERYNVNLVEKMFVAFDIKLNRAGSDYSFFFKDIFDIIIKKYILLQLKEEAKNMIVNDDDRLLSLKSKAEPTIPICSLQSFIQNNQEECKEYLLIWLYFIAKELSYIHSHDIFYGDLSSDKIGLYYNRSLKMLVPSIILSYSYYKRGNYNSGHFGSDKIDKLKKKDIKKFKTIVKSNENYLIKSPFDTIENVDTMNEIIYYLFNFIKNNNADKNTIEICNFSFDDYSSFKMTYSSMNDAFELLIFENYSFKGLTINFLSIYETINEFLKNTKDNMNMKILCNFPVIDLPKDNIQKPDDILALIEENNIKCISLYEAITNTKTKNDDIDIIITENENEIKISKKNKEKNENWFTKPCSFEFINYSSHTIEKTFIIAQNNLKKPIFRKICWNRLDKRTYKLLLKRYLSSLCPQLHYRITLKVYDRNKNKNKNDNHMYKDEVIDFIKNECCKYARLKQGNDGPAVDIIDENGIYNLTFGVLPRDN